MLQRFEQELSKVQQSHRLVVAFSGGLDSCSLLHMVATRYPERTLAVHIHHGLSANADAWTQHCAAVCQQLGVDFAVREVDANAAAGVSPEDAARTARYQALSEFIDQDSCLLTAHTLDDQTETVLLQLFRGAGPKGLSAMPHQAKFGEGVLLRPLLDISRSELEHYVNTHQLSWITDESNADIKFDRNFIRAQLIPTIKQRWPSINQTIARVAKHCAQTIDLVESVAEQDLSKAHGSLPNTLSIKMLRSMGSLRQNQLLRYWFHQHELLMPTTVQLEQIITQFINSAEDKQPHMLLGDHELRRYGDDLFLLTPSAELDPTDQLSWQIDQPLELPGGLGVLTKANLRHPNLPAQVTVRFRQGGERAKPVGRDHTHTLKNLFQEWGVPPWLRARIPLIYDDDRLLEVVGYAVFES